MKLERKGEILGTVGERTNYRTVHGEDVHIGDLVKVNIMGGVLTVIEPMVKGNTLFDGEKCFVMGIEIACDGTEGTVEGDKILEIVKPYTALEVGDELGECEVVVIADKEEEKEAPAGDDLGQKIFFGIIDKAISDLKDAGKDYHGLDFIKTMLIEGGLK